MKFVKSHFLILIISILSLIVSAINWYNNKKICFVDTIELFNEFALTKELENQDAPVLNEYKSKLDSLKGIYQNLRNESSRDTLGITIYQFENEYKKVSDNSNKRINDLVWARLNKLIDKYAEQNKIQLLIGANGMGTVLHGEPQRDETSNLLKYCNKEYHGE